MDTESTYLPPTLSRSKLNNTLLVNETSSTFSCSIRNPSSSSDINSSSLFSLNISNETVSSPLSTNLADIITCIAEMLTLDDIRALVCTNKDWSQSTNLLRYVHTLKFSDLHLNNNNTNNNINNKENEKYPISIHHPCELPEPEQMIRLSRLDLTGYINTGSPHRPIRTSSIQSGKHLSESNTARTSVVTSTSTSLTSTPNNRASSIISPKEPNILTTTTNTLTLTSSKLLCDSPNSQNSNTILPRSITLSTENNYTDSSINTRSSSLVSSDSYSQSAQSWLAKFLSNQYCCLRLTVLKLSNTVPRYIQEYFLSQCKNIRSLSLRLCEMTDDSLIMKLPISKELKAIDLNSCWRITDEGIQHIQQTCPNMEKALFDGVWKLTDTSIESILQNWPKLSILELTGSHHNIMYTSITNLLMHHKNLRALRLSNMHFASNIQGWYDIFTACLYAAQTHSFQVIEISQAPYLTNDALLYYYSLLHQSQTTESLINMKKLPKIIIRSCIQINNNYDTTNDNVLTNLIPHLHIYH